MSNNIWIESLFIILFLWWGGYLIYLKCNTGLAKNARGQQMRRYLFAAIPATIPIGVSGTTIGEPTILISLFVAFTWMITYPLLYHLTNKNIPSDYPNAIDIAFGIYLFGCLSGLIILFPQISICIALLEFILCLFPVSQWVYYITCKGCINTNGMKMLQETHYNEIIEFLRSYHPLKVIATFVVIITICWCFIYINIRYQLIHTNELNCWQLTVISFVCLFMMTYLWKPKHGLFIRTGIVDLYNIVKEYRINNNKYIEQMQQRISNLVVENCFVDDNTPKTIMLVIGESASRDFMSAFSNMDVDTTPWMNEMKKDSKHCIFFPNAYSCDIQTVPTLEKALTEFNQYDGGQFYKSCSIVDIAHKLGWKVHWYSNQGHLGAADTPITLVANTSDVAKWTKQELNKVQYDEALIEFLDEINPSVNNLVVLHLKGSHFNFNNRFPESMRQWGEAKSNDNIINYKNSLYYTDSVLKRFYEYGYKYLNLQAMVYLSDHGCVPDRHRLPNFGGFGDTRIPLMIWISDEYIKNHEYRAMSIKKNRLKYWTNDLTYDLMCGIFDIKSNHFYEKNSLASNDYNHTIDSLVIMDGKIKINNDN